ncbi:hypothetical protein P7C70_g5515, partial [Phenoliferia sp. Uapishka_3]
MTEKPSLKFTSTISHRFQYFSDTSIDQLSSDLAKVLDISMDELAFWYQGELVLGAEKMEDFWGEDDDGGNTELAFDFSKVLAVGQVKEESVKERTCSWPSLVRSITAIVTVIDSRADWVRHAPTSFIIPCFSNSSVREVHAATAHHLGLALHNFRLFDAKDCEYLSMDNRLRLREFLRDDEDEMEFFVDLA